MNRNPILIGLNTFYIKPVSVVSLSFKKDIFNQTQFNKNIVGEKQ